MLPKKVNFIWIRVWGVHAKDFVENNGDLWGEQLRSI